MPAKTKNKPPNETASTNKEATQATVEDIGAPVNQNWLDFYAEVRRYGAQIEAHKAQQAQQNEQAKAA